MKHKQHRIRIFAIFTAVGGLLMIAFMHGEAQKIGMEMSAITLAHLLATEVF